VRKPHLLHLRDGHLQSLAPKKVSVSFFYFQSELRHFVQNHRN
jgi:hypothetical protein